MEALMFEQLQKSIREAGQMRRRAQAGATDTEADKVMHGIAKEMDLVYDPKWGCFRDKEFPGKVSFWVGDLRDAVEKAVVQATLQCIRRSKR